MPISCPGFAGRGSLVGRIVDKKSHENILAKIPTPRLVRNCANRANLGSHRVPWNAQIQ